MATYTAAAAQAGVQPKALRVGLTNVKSVFSFDGISSSIGTVVHMVKVPANARVAYLQYHGNVSGEFTLQVGDSVNGERFRSTSVYSGGVGAVSPPSLAQTMYQYSVDDTIIMRMSAVSVVTLGGAFYMNVIFSMDS
jgi:hypothetical protein